MHSASCNNVFFLLQPLLMLVSCFFLCFRLQTFFPPDSAAGLHFKHNATSAYRVVPGITSYQWLPRRRSTLDMCGALWWSANWKHTSNLIMHTWTSVVFVKKVYIIHNRCILRLCILLICVSSQLFWWRKYFYQMYTNNVSKAITKCFLVVEITLPWIQNKIIYITWLIICFHHNMEGCFHR